MCNLKRLSRRILSRGKIHLENSDLIRFSNGQRTHLLLLRQNLTFFPSLKYNSKNLLAGIAYRVKRKKEGKEKKEIDAPLAPRQAGGTRDYHRETEENDEREREQKQNVTTILSCARDAYKTAVFFTARELFAAGLIAGKSDERPICRRLQLLFRKATNNRTPDE